MTAKTLQSQQTITVVKAKGNFLPKRQTFSSLLANLANACVGGQLDADQQATGHKGQRLDLSAALRGHNTQTTQRARELCFKPAPTQLIGAYLIN